MDNSSLGYALESNDQTLPTYTESERGNGERRFGVSRPRSSLSNLGGVLVLGFTVISSPIAFSDPRRELRQSGSATTMVVFRQKHRRRITLAEAWTRAGEVYADAQRRRIQQREREAREFLWSFTEDVE